MLCTASALKRIEVRWAPQNAPTKLETLMLGGISTNICT